LLARAPAAPNEIGVGNHRFDQIVRNTGAGRDILATRLRKLVEAGVLDMQQYESHPPRYEYVLTEAGRSLRPILHGLMQWGDRHVTRGRAPAELEHACGAALQVEPVCAHCGQPVDFDEIRVRRLGAVH
jgi:DNA-binding HxlR family transcriptional regulator